MCVSLNLQHIHISQPFKKHFQSTHCSLLQRFATIEKYMHFCFSGEVIFRKGQKYARQIIINY